MHWYLAALKKYATMTGRSRRKEFWHFAVVNLLGTIGLSLFVRLTGDIEGAWGEFVAAIGLLWLLAVVLVIIPTITVAVRRFHDTGSPGAGIFLLFLPVFNLFALYYLLVKEGQPEDNKYGADPKALCRAAYSSHLSIAP